jgi:hypothetical protein
MGTHQFSKIHSKSHKNFRGSVDDLRNVSKIIASPSQGIHIPKTVWIINLLSDRGIFLLKGVRSPNVTSTIIQSKSI